jgi:hypothetical protein
MFNEVKSRLSRRMRVFREARKDSVRAGVMMKSPFVLVSVLCALTLPSLLAQTSSDPPATRDNVLALFSLMNIREQVTSVMESVATQQRQIMHDNLKRQVPRVSPEEFARLDQFMADVMKELPVDGMIDDMVPVYQKHLNKSDVDAMSAFYSSPTGRKLLREMPAMTAESMQAASPRIQAMMDRVMERARAMANEKEPKTATPPKTDDKK